MPNVFVGKKLTSSLHENGHDSRKHIEHVPALPVARAIWKRAMDLVVASLFLLVFLPVMVVVALLVRLSSKGPVIYKARRVGLSGSPFLMFKFRSMYEDADERLKDLWAKNDHSGPVFKMKHDPRITPVGAFLRKYSIDELPQFLNVLSGEMSLVGPRALHDYEVEKFNDSDRTRLAVKPGITCYWQIMGRSRLSFEEWMDLDRRYVMEVSLITDLRILWRTPKAVFKSDGAF